MPQPWPCDAEGCPNEAIYVHTYMPEGQVTSYCEEHNAGFICTWAEQYGMVFPDVPHERDTPPGREEPTEPVDDHDEATMQTDHEAEPTGDALPDDEPEPVTHRPKRGTSRTTE